VDLKFELSTTCTLLAVRRISTLVRRVLLQFLTRPFVYSLELAVAEICTNLAKYSPRGQESLPLLVRIELKDSTAQLTIIDHGPPFDLRQYHRPTIDEKDPKSIPTGGFGLPLVHDTLDVIDYKTEKGRNTITLVKTVSRIDGSDIG
jgi:anti-sigma regulatory factor (Ser/Thr protein kinase)